MKDENYIPKILERISTWNKWDLHIHTPATNKMVQNDYKNPLLFTPAKFVDEMLDKKIKLAAITDHNIFDKDQFEKLCVEVNDRRLKDDIYLKLLPGVEINVKFSNPQDKSIHFILIFNDNVNYDDLVLAINTLNTEIGFSRGNPANATIKQIAETFSKFEYTVSIHLGKASNKPEAVNYDEFLKIYIGGFIDICENNPANTEKNIQYLEKRLESILTDEKKNNTYIVGSDNHDITVYPLCEGTRDIPKITYYKSIPSFEGLKLVITDSSRIYNSDDDTLPKYITNGKDINKIEAIRIESDKFECDDIYFARELNTIIGPRTSGKSLFINIIKKILENDYDKNKYQDYMDSLKIKIKTFDDKEFIDSSSVQLEIVSQNSLMKELDDTKVNKDFFENDYIKKLFEGLSIDNDILIQTFNKEIGDELSFLSNLVLLKDKIDDFKTPNTYLKSYANFHKGESKLKDFYTKISLAKNFTLANEQNDLKIKYIDESIKKIELIIDGDVYDILTPEMKQNLFDIKKYIINKKAEINKLKNVLEKIKLLDMSKYKPYDIDMNFVKNHSDFITKIKNIAIIKSKLDKLLKSDKLFINRTFKINGKEEYEKSTKINDFIFKCYVKYNIDFHSTKDSSEHIITKRFYNNDIKSGWSELVKKAFTKKLDQNVLFKSGDIDVIKQDILKKIPKVTSTILDDKGTDINFTSPGNRASILITIILENTENKILVLDQPEDNLDSKFIYDEIVERVKKLKNNRQIFIVTHNANIVVNSDSENIIACSNNDNIISYQYGAIEFGNKVFKYKNMKDYILDTLEGGRIAFENRNAKYFLKGMVNISETNNR